jgi:hypothetical protein
MGTTSRSKFKAAVFEEPSLPRTGETAAATAIAAIAIKPCPVLEQLPRNARLLPPKNSLIDQHFLMGSYQGWLARSNGATDGVDAKSRATGAGE